MGFLAQNIRGTLKSIRTPGGQQTFDLNNTPLEEEFEENDAKAKRLKIEK